ncbi:transporter substrate-binding domain-containing protein [Amycolatopsis sp. NPDC051102]|uniref:caspase, EACC1-associated type n=1 Tax=Amycolatopsis sp. NPDC051102 TaxID=3155163 RepID=UPI00344A1CD8
MADPGSSRALLVGCGKYRHLRDVPAVAAGVQGLQAALTDPRLWGLPSAHCPTVTDPASAGDVLDRIRDSAAAATDLFVFCFAGHGFIDLESDELFLALPTTDRTRPWTGLPYDWIRRALRHPGVRAKRKLIVLDCCYSGVALGGTLAADAADHAAVDGVCVLTASAETKTALALRGEPFTAFTGELLTTLTRGVPGGPAILDIDTVYAHLRAGLRAKGRPLPQLRSRNAGTRIPLVRNLAGPPPPPAARPSRKARVTAAAVLATTLLTAADTVPLPALSPPVAMVACRGSEPLAPPPAGPLTRTPAVAAATASLAGRSTLIIGTMLARPGLAERCPDGTLRGFDVAIGQLVAADLGYPPEQVHWLDLAAGERLSAVQTYRVDIVAGSMAITDSRRQRLRFGGPYEESSQSLMAAGATTSIDSRDSFRDPALTVCAADGSSAAENLRPYSNNPGQLLTRRTVADCLQLLLQGRTTAVSADRSVLLGYLLALGTRAKLVGPAFADSYYGLAVRKDQHELADGIDDILERSYQDGRYRSAWRLSLGKLLPEVTTGPPIDRTVG